MLKMATEKRRRAKISLVIAILFILQTFLSSGVVYAAPVEEGAYGDRARISALPESGTEESASPESGTEESASPESGAWDREEGAEDAEISSEGTASLQGINNSKEEASFKVNRTGTRSGKLPKIVSDAIGSGNGSGVVEMFDDIRITSPIKVPSGKTLTLIMNGHSIDRNMGKSKGDGMIFLLEENSTLKIEGGRSAQKYPVALPTSRKDWYHVSGKDTVEVDRGLLYGGFSDDSGGCIEMKSGAKAYLNEVMIAGNGADTFLKMHGYGGAVWMRANNVLEMKSSIIEGNFAASHGGAIYVDGAGCRIKLDPYSQINYNYSRGSGGAVYVDDDYCYINGESTMHISRSGDEGFSMSRMDYNRANGGYGGAIYVNNNYFTDYPGAIAGFSMKGNSSNDDGGAVYLHRKKYKVANCIFDGNKAGERGGAVYVDVADIGLDNVEIKGNEAGKNGGGVYLSPDGTGFSGRVVVKDNKNGNIYIEKGDKADFASLSGGSEVFITCENTEDGRVVSSKPGTFTEGYFNCDNSSYHLEWNNSGDRNLVLKSGAKKSSGLDYTELDGKYRRECGNAGFTYTPVSTAADAQADATGQSVLVGYASSPSHTDEEKDIVNKYFYSDGYFFEDPKVYNPHLATFTMNMAMASADSNYESHDDYRNKFANIKNLFLGIGISENAIFVNDWYIRKPTDDSIGCAIGSKTIKGKSTGAEYSLVAVAIRSYNYESEWASNMTIGGKKERYAEHKGFNSAKRQVLTAIENYIKDYGLSNDLKTGKVRFLVTGFSRGSATTNLVSKELVDRYVTGDASDPEADPYDKPQRGNKYEEYKGKGNRVYAYCQAVPAGGVEERDFGLNSDRYYCIHNVVNKVDLTPMVAPSNMGFKRYGVDHYVPGYPAGTQGLAVRKVTLTAEDDDSTPKKSDLTIFFDGKADGKESWQNKDWWVGTDLYKKQRTEMLKQLKMVNEEVSFEDYFHMAAMAFISSSPGPYEIDKGYKNLEEFMPAFYNRLTDTYKVLYYLPGSDKNLNMSRNRYSNYQLREKKSDWKGVTSEKAIRETMMLLLSKTPSEKANLTAALTGVIGKFSYVFSTEKTLKNLHTQLLSSTKGWDGLSDSDQKVWLDTFWDKMNNTSDGSMGLKDAMNDEELSRFKSDFSTILEIALRFANQDYNDTAGTFNTGDVAQHLGTMAYNVQAILQGHVPEIALAWHRSYDSCYDNEGNKAYSFKNYSGKPGSPVASLSSGREYAGNQLLEFDYNIDSNCLYTIKKTDEQGKTYAEMDGKKLFLYQPGLGIKLEAPLRGDDAYYKYEISAYTYREGGAKKSDNVSAVVTLDYTLKPAKRKIEIECEKPHGESYWTVYVNNYSSNRGAYSGDYIKIEYVENDENSRFFRWLKDGVEYSRLKSFSFIMPDEDQKFVLDLKTGEELAHEVTIKDLEAPVPGKKLKDRVNIKLAADADDKYKERTLSWYYKKAVADEWKRDDDGIANYGVTYEARTDFTVPQEGSARLRLGEDSSDGDHSKGASCNFVGGVTPTGWKTNSTVENYEDRVSVTLGMGSTGSAHVGISNEMYPGVYYKDDNRQNESVVVKLKSVDENRDYKYKVFKNNVVWSDTTTTSEEAEIHLPYTQPGLYRIEAWVEGSTGEHDNFTYTLVGENGKHYIKPQFLDSLEKPLYPDDPEIGGRYRAPFYSGQDVFYSAPYIIAKNGTPYYYEELFDPDVCEDALMDAAYIFDEWRETPQTADVSGPSILWNADVEYDIAPQAIYSIVMEPEGKVYLETPETGSDLPEKVTALKVKLADREDLVSIDPDSVKLTWYGDDPYDEEKEQKPVTGLTMGSTNYGAMLSLSLNGLKYDRAGGTDYTEAPDIILSDAWYDFGFDDEDWTSGFDLYDEKGEEVDEETGLIGFREGEYDPETGEESGALLYAFYGTTEAAWLLSVEGAGSFSLPEGKEKNKASLTELLKDSANTVTVWVDDLSIRSMAVDWENAKVEDFVPDSLNDQIATVTGSLIIPKLISGGMVEGEKDAVDTELYKEMYDIPEDEDIPVTAEIFVPGAEHSAYPSASPDEGTVYKPDPGESLQIHLSPGEENEEVYYTLTEIEDWEKDYDTIPLSFTYDESKKSYIPDSGAIKYVQGSEDTEETEILLDGTKDAIIQIAGLTPGKQPSDIKVLRYYFEKQYAVISDGDRAAIDGLTIKRGETLRSEVLPQIPADFTYAEDNEIPLDKRITDPAGSKFRISLTYNPDPDTYHDTWTEGEVTVLGDDALPIAVLPEGYQDMLNNLFISKGEKLVTIKDQLPEGVLFPDKETEEMIIDNEPGSLRTIKLIYNPDSTKFRPLTVYGEVRVFGPGLAPGEEDMAVIRALKLKRGSTLSDLTGLPPFFFIHPDEDVDKVHNEPVGTSFEVALVYRPDPGAYDPTKVNGRVTIVSDDGQEFPGSADAADYLGSKGGKAKASLVSRDAKSITFKLADADFYLRYSYIINFDGSKHMADLGGKTSNGKKDYDVTVEVLDKDMKPMDGKSYKASIKNNVNATLNEDGITRLPQITDRKRPRMTVKFKGKNAEAKKAFKGLWFYLDIMPVEINESNVTGSVEKPKKEGLPPRFKKLSFTNAYDKSFGMKSKKNPKKSDFDYTPGETGVTIRGRNNYRGTKFLSYTIK